MTADAAGGWAQWPAEDLERLVDAIVDVSRELARQVPPPRGAAFFGLDSPSGDLSALERLSAQGIFRKYETVLELGSGLGAAARWSHTHFGCRVVGLETEAAAAGAARLSGRASVGDTRFLAADLGAVPVRSRHFTHVWCLDRLADVQVDDPRLREALRVLRPGAHVAIQQVGGAGAWADRAAAAVARVGFIEVEISSVTRPRLPERMRMARERLLRHLERMQGNGKAIAARLEALYRHHGEEAAEIALVLARRPAVEGS